MATDEGDQNNTLLDYARHHALTLDHTLEDISDIEFFVPAHGNIENVLRDPDGALAFPSYIDIEHDKLVIDTETRSFLAEIIRPMPTEMSLQRLRESEIELDESDVRGHRSSKDLKLELPLLRTDPDVDVLTCRRKQQPTSFGKVKFELLPVDEEADGGLKWPQKYLDLSNGYNQQCRTEKLTMSRGNVLWLRDQLALQDATTAIEEITVDELRRRTVPEPLTPPLSPVSFRTLLEQKSSSPVADPYPLLSEHTSPSVHIQKEVDTALMDGDAPNLDMPQNDMNTDNFGALYSPLMSDQLPISSSPARLRAERLKLEQPLTPMIAIRPSKTVSSVGQSPDYVPDLMPVEDDDMLLDASETDIDQLFQKTFGDSAIAVTDQLGNEKLIEADSTMRLPVPKLDLVVPMLPWMHEHAVAHRWAKDTDLMATIKRMKLHKISTGFERELSWHPLPSHAAINVTDDLMDYTDLVEDFIHCTSIEEAVVHDNLSWKPDGLRFLDERESDTEELEPASFAPPDHFGGLLLKRKLEMDKVIAQAGHIESLPRAPETIKTTKQRERGPPSFPISTAPRTTGPVKKQPTTAIMQLEPDLFSASDELSRFMDLYTGQIHKKRKVNCPPQGRPSTSENTCVAARPPKSLHREIAIPAMSAESPGEVELDLPTPDVTSARPIIVSSTFLTTHRSVVTQLTTKHPNLQLIERDFAGLEHTGFSPASAGKPVSSSNAAPDLILNPRTSIILTTLQKVKQKPLPGQSFLSPLRKRILEVSQTCERLIVIITSARGLIPDERDVLALSDLICFTSTQAGNIEALFRAVSAQKEIARYILAILATEDAEKAPEEQQYDLLQEETTWEVFLRRAGLNPFAAQMVLATLKEPDNSPQTTVRDGSSAHGLPAYVQMSADERRARFRNVMGSDRVLDRVSTCLDGAWATQER